MTSPRTPFPFPPPFAAPEGQATRDDVLAAALRQQTAVLERLAIAADSITAVLRTTPQGLLQAGGWDYVQRTDRATRALTAGGVLPLYSSRRRGWLQTVYVRGNSPSFRLRVAVDYPGGNHAEVSGTPQELLDDGLTRPTQTWFPYTPLFDDTAVQYAVAVDVPFPGHPFFGELVIRVENRTSASIDLTNRQLRTVELIP